MTLIADGGPSDELFARGHQQFTEEELVNLNLAFAVINTWDRFAKTFHTQPALQSFKPTPRATV